MTRPRQTNDSCTFILSLADGGELVIRADHGRVYLDRFARGRRSVLTTAMDTDRAAEFFARGLEIAAVAPSTRRSAA